jgi:Raf kinase inhibitor-like YbhB/YbcL family protein
MNSFQRIAFFLLLVLFCGCRGGSTATSSVKGFQSGAAARSMTLTSSAFDACAQIPKQFTCDGENISPPLKWNGAPSGTQSFAVIMNDPDAPSGDFTHWLLFNIPASASQLAQGEQQLGTAGQNDFGKIGYGGPCPPSGRHRYIIHLYALDSTLSLQSGALRRQVEQAMPGHVLGEATLTASYSR